MYRTLSIASLVIILISLALVYVYFANIDRSLIIHLDSYHNLTYLGDKNDVLRIVFIGWLLVLLNIFLIRIIEKNYSLIAKILAWGTVLLSLLILVVIGGIILTN